MLYDLSMSESNKYENLKSNFVSTVYVIQEIAGTRAGNPKINIMGAANYGQFKFLLPEFSQMIFSPGPLIYKLRQGLKDYKKKDYLLLTGDLQETEYYQFSSLHPVGLFQNQLSSISPFSYRLISIG